MPNKQKEIPLILTLPNYKLCVGVAGVNTSNTNSSQLNRENCNIQKSKDTNIKSSIEIKELNADQNIVKPHCCPVCERRFMFKHWLSKHMKNECSGREFICDICSQSMYNYSDYEVNLELN